jgi:hypothetical protein
VTFCRGLKLPAADGKLREADCVNTEGIFRIIQSIPSPKVEPLKRTLAKVGYDMLADAAKEENIRCQDIEGFAEIQIAALKGRCISGEAREKRRWKSAKAWLHRKII